MMQVQYRQGINNQIQGEDTYLNVQQIGHYLAKFQSRLVEIHQTDQEQSSIKLFQHYRDLLKTTLQMSIGICKNYQERQKQFIDNQLNFESIINQKNNKIDSLSEDFDYVKIKLKNAQEHAEKLNEELISLNEKIVTLDEEHEKEKKQIHSQYDHQNHNHQQLEIDQIQLQNITLTKQLEHYQREKAQMQQNINTLTEAIFKLNTQIIQLQGKLEWEIQKKNQLYQELKTKNDVIYKLQYETQQLKQLIRNPFVEDRKVSIDISNDYQILSPSNQDQVITLSEDIYHKEDLHKINYTITQKMSEAGSRYNDDYNIEDVSTENVDVKKNPLTASFRATYQENSKFQTKQYNQKNKEKFLEKINSSINNSNIERQKKKLTVKMTDPYFSHFILTSQSVKIRQDCQELLNIDVKPFYKQMLDKRIPMHLWDQWIRNKLKQVAKQNKNSII